jgi:hypothetical protein
MGKITGKFPTASRKPVTSNAPTPVVHTPVGQPAKALGFNNYPLLSEGVSALLTAARRAAARPVNAIMTATYREVGRRVVEHEQGGKARAEYGKALLGRLAADLGAQFGRGFAVDNPGRLRAFYLAWPPDQISATLPRKSPMGAKSAILPTVLAASSLARIDARFPLPWSAYVRLLAIMNEHARRFYEDETLRGGWSVRQVDRQIGSPFYERTALSKNKAAMLTKGAVAKPEEKPIAEELDRTRRLSEGRKRLGDWDEIPMPGIR